MKNVKVISIVSLLLFGHLAFCQEQIIINMCKDTDKPIKGLVVIQENSKSVENKTDDYNIYVSLDPIKYLLFKSYLLNSDLKRNFKNPYFNECHLLNAIIIDSQPRSYYIKGESQVQRFLMSFIDISKQFSLGDDLERGIEDMLIAVIGYNNYKDMYL